MDWYWWVLIGIGVIAIGFVKLKFFNSYLKKKQKEKEEQQKTLRK